MPEVKNKIPQQPINGQSSGLTKVNKYLTGKLMLIGGVLISLIIGIVAGIFIWYNIQLSPVGGDINQLKKVTIVAGSTPSQIAKELKDQSIIRSSVAFDIYLRLSGKINNLQAGTYRLSPAETTPQIIKHLINGSVDQFSITFYPGATLTDSTNSSKKYDVTTVLKSAGYSNQEISTALTATYDSPLFDSKPSNTDLEGYIYGETYNFSTGATVQDILKRTFDEYYSVIKGNNIIEGLSRQGLNLYQGITLASVVQREANEPTDQKQVAQVFYLRLQLGMVLGSDVTYQYIADKTGVARDPNLDSPYNTRRFGGLPPGPIAVPGINALLAVANPASGDYLYFLSGDDNVTYFARTFAEHEANIANHCKIKCSTP